MATSLFEVVGRISYEGADKVARQFDTLERTGDQVEDILNRMGTTAHASSQFIDRMADEGKQGFSEMERAAHGTGDAIQDIDTAGSAAAAGISRLERGLDGAASGADHIESAAQGAAGALGRMESEMGQTETAAQGAERAADGAGGAFTRLATKVINSAKNAAGSWDKVADGIKKVGDKAESVGDSMKTKLSLPLAGLGTAAGLAAVNVDQATGRIQARLGLTGKAAQDVADQAQDLWARGFGESMEGVADDITIVIQNMQGLGKEGEGAAQRATEAAYNLQRAYGVDITESTRTASVMMTNFGIDSEHAFDLIAKGFQKGGNYSQDLLDTLWEYSNQFASMGFSSDQFMNTLIKGAKAGAFSTDKLGDSVKEFNQRAQDGSETTADGFAAIGLNAGEMGAAIAQGGDKAQNAFMATLVGLAGMTNEQERNNAGIQLFGTQWEDVRDKAILAMADTTDELGKVEGSTKKAGDAMRDNFGDRFTVMFRQLQLDMIPLGNTVLDLAEKYLPPLIDTIGKVATWFDKLSPSIQQGIVIFGAIMAILGPVIAVFGMFAGWIGNIIGVAVKLWPIISKAGGAFNILRTALTVLTGPVGIVIAIITALIAVGMAIYKNWSTLGPLLSSLWAGIVSVFQSTMSGIASFFSAIWSGIVAAFDGAASGLKAIGSGIATFFTGLWDGIVSGAQAIWSVLSTVIQTGIAILVVIVQTAVTLLLLPWQFLWENFKGVLIPIWQSISSFLSNTFNTIRSVVVSVWSAMVNTIVSIAQSVYNFILPIFQTLKAGILTVFNAIRSAAQTAWNGLKTVIMAVANAIKTGALAVFRTLKSGIQTIWSGIKSAAQAAWKLIQTYIVNPATAAKNKAVSIFKSMQSSISSAFNSIKSKATSVWNGIKNAIVNPVNSARDKVSSAISKIKSLFSGLKLRLPDIKTPHFSFKNWSMNPKDWIKARPSIGVDWYDKGGIFNSPSIIGVGEKRPEFVGALDDLRGIVTASMGDFMRGNPQPAATGGGDVFNITVDASNVKELNDLVRMAQDFRQTVRRG